MVAPLAIGVSKRPRDPGLARKLYLKEHEAAFKVLRSMQDARYRSDERRKRLVSLYYGVDVRKLTFGAYVNSKWVAARLPAQLRIRNIAHLLRLVSPVRT